MRSTHAVPSMLFLISVGILGLRPCAVEPFVLPHLLSFKKADVLATTSRAMEPRGPYSPFLVASPSWIPNASILSRTWQHTSELTRTSGVHNGGNGDSGGRGGGGRSWGHNGWDPDEGDDADKPPVMYLAGSLFGVIKDLVERVQSSWDKVQRRLVGDVEHEGQSFARRCAS